MGAGLYASGIDRARMPSKRRFGDICQWEREVMLKRQRIGISKARTEKRYRGHKPVAAPNADAVCALKAEGSGMTQIGKKLGISRASVYRALESAWRRPSISMTTSPNAFATPDAEGRGLHRTRNGDNDGGLHPQESRRSQMN
jgi:hypothetical protein